MAHYDVVPVTNGWKHDPFLGEVVDGYFEFEHEGLWMSKNVLNERHVAPVKRAIKIAFISIKPSPPYLNKFSTMPSKPKKARDTNEAAINVAGRTLKCSGISLSSILERTPEKSTIASINPRPQPNELTIDSPKLNPSLMLLIVTPKTAQFVVISGK